MAKKMRLNYRVEWENGTGEKKYLDRTGRANEAVKQARILVEEGKPVVRILVEQTWEWK